MRTYTQRLTPIGWLGAVLFVAPTPLSYFLLRSTVSEMASTARYRELYEQATGVTSDLGTFSAFPYVLLATLSLVGLVMILVGRETTAFD